MNKSGAELDSLTKARWEFLIRCWEYNVRIWRDTFLEHRIQNPLVGESRETRSDPPAGKIIWSLLWGKAWRGR
jgi:hypothetical protein